MLRNYLKVAFRNLRRNKSYAAINVVGLAVGLASVLLIGLYLRSELSYDDFHEQSERIYRVAETMQREDEASTSLYLPAPLAPALASEQPAVESAVRLYRLHGGARVERGGETFYEDGFFAADSTFFDIFDGFELVQGHAQAALTDPYSLVISKDMAEKYFGNAENPVRKTLTVKGSAFYTGGEKTYTVTGVARVPERSHLQFSFLTSYATLRSAIPADDDRFQFPWRYHSYYTYLLLDRETPPQAIESEIHGLYARHYPEELAQRYSHTLQPLESIHLHSNTDAELQPGGDPRYLYIFGAVALLILGVACVNYTNLATARAAQRAKEVGVRKTVGATCGSLARQFLGEALLFSLLALVLAVGLARLALPFFNDLLAQPLSFSYAGDGTMLAALAAAGVAVGLLSGSYPALFLSRFRPTEVLRGGFRLGRRGALLRGGLLVFQFGVAVALVAGTLVIGQQLDHVRTRRLGLDAERVVTIHARDALDDENVSSTYGAFKNELLQQTGIEHVTAAGQELPFPVDRDMALSLAPEGVDTGNESDQMSVNTLSVALGFTETMGIPVVRGRDLTRAVYRESEGGMMPVLINEAAADAFGWDDPVGKTFSGLGDGLRVVGVVQDFHYQSLKAQIEPLVLRPLTYRTSHVMVRVQSGNLPDMLDRIESTWASVTNAPFDYGFLDRRFDQLYRADQRLATLIGGFSGLAVLVACLGLFGLAAYAAERRRKEIAVRKTFGASARQIVQLLSKDFLKLVGIGFAIATPVAYFAMQRWLEGFAYRIALGPGVFALAGALVLTVALLTVGTQALRAARANPADALRNE